VSTAPHRCLQQRSEIDGTHADEHASAAVLRGGYLVELVRHLGDPTTYAGLLQPDDGGPRIAIPVATLIQLTTEAKQLSGV
jgi:hypothetical protein